MVGVGYYRPHIPSIRTGIEMDGVGPSAGHAPCDNLVESILRLFLLGIYHLRRCFWRKRLANYQFTTVGRYINTHTGKKEAEGSEEFPGESMC